MSPSLNDAGLGGSVGCMSDWWSGGYRFAGSATFIPGD